MGQTENNIAGSPIHISEARIIERFKAITDYLKHLTTLSTGSIVLIATFLEKLFTKPLWKTTVIISIVGFMASVLSSIVAYTIIIVYENPAKSNETPDWAAFWGAFTVLITWVGFWVGILSLAIFAIRNLIQ